MKFSPSCLANFLKNPTKNFSPHKILTVHKNSPSFDFHLTRMFGLFSCHGDSCPRDKDSSIDPEDNYDRKIRENCVGGSEPDRLDGRQTPTLNLNEPAQMQICIFLLFYKQRQRPMITCFPAFFLELLNNVTKSNGREKRCDLGPIAFKL